MVFDLLEFSFFQNAFIATLLVSVAVGVMGTLITLKRIVFLSGGIAHASLGGVGLGFLLGVTPILTLIPFSVLTALLLVLFTRKFTTDEDSAIGILWSVGIALGILFIWLTPGYVPSLQSFLFGSVLTVTDLDLGIMFGLDVLILGTVIGLYKEFLALIYDEEFMRVRGLPVTWFYTIFFVLMSLSVVVLVQMVGVILVIAFLSIPPATARLLTTSIPRMMILAGMFAFFSSFGGLIAASVFELPAGAIIILLAAALFLVSVGIRSIYRGH